MDELQNYFDKQVKELPIGGIDGSVDETRVGEENTLLIENMELVPGKVEKRMGYGILGTPPIRSTTLAFQELEYEYLTLLTLTAPVFMLYDGVAGRNIHDVIPPNYRTAEDLSDTHVLLLVDTKLDNPPDLNTLLKVEKPTGELYFQPVAVFPVAEDPQKRLLVVPKIVYGLSLEPIENNNGILVATTHKIQVLSGHMHKRFHPTKMVYDYPDLTITCAVDPEWRVGYNVILEGWSNSSGKYVSGRITAIGSGNIVLDITDIVDPHLFNEAGVEGQYFRVYPNKIGLHRESTGIQYFEVLPDSRINALKLFNPPLASTTELMYIYGTGLKEPISRVGCVELPDGPRWIASTNTGSYKLGAMEKSTQRFDGYFPANTSYDRDSETITLNKGYRTITGGVYTQNVYVEGLISPPKSGDYLTWNTFENETGLIPNKVKILAVTDNGSSYTLQVPKGSLYGAKSYTGQQAYLLKKTSTFHLHSGVQVLVGDVIKFEGYNHSFEVIAIEGDGNVTIDTEVEVSSSELIYRMPRWEPIATEINQPPWPIDTETYPLQRKFTGALPFDFSLLTFDETGVYRFNGELIYNMNLPAPPVPLVRSKKGTRSNLRTRRTSDGVAISNTYKFTVQYAYYDVFGRSIEGPITPEDDTEITPEVSKINESFTEEIELQVISMPKGLWIPADRVEIRVYMSTLDDGGIASPFYPVATVRNNPGMPFTTFTVKGVGLDLTGASQQMLDLREGSNARFPLTNISTMAMSRLWMAGGYSEPYLDIVMEDIWNGDKPLLDTVFDLEGYRFLPVPVQFKPASDTYEIEFPVNGKYGYAADMIGVGSSVTLHAPFIINSISLIDYSSSSLFQHLSLNPSTQGLPGDGTRDYVIGGAIRSTIPKETIIDLPINGPIKYVRTKVYDSWGIEIDRQTRIYYPSPASDADVSNFATPGSNSFSIQNLDIKYFLNIYTEDFKTPLSFGTGETGFDNHKIEITVNTDGVVELLLGPTVNNLFIMACNNNIRTPELVITGLGNYGYIVADKGTRPLSWDSDLTWTWVNDYVPGKTNYPLGDYQETLVVLDSGGDIDQEATKEVWGSFAGGSKVRLYPVDGHFSRLLKVKKTNIIKGVTIEGLEASISLRITPGSTFNRSILDIGVPKNELVLRNDAGVIDSDLYPTWSTGDVAMIRLGDLDSTPSWLGEIGTHEVLGVQRVIDGTDTEIRRIKIKVETSAPDVYSGLRNVVLGANVTSGIETIMRATSFSSDSIAMVAMQKTMSSGHWYSLIHKFTDDTLSIKVDMERLPEYTSNMLQAGDFVYIICRGYQPNSVNLKLTGYFEIVTIDYPTSVESPIYLTVKYNLPLDYEDLADVSYLGVVYSYRHSGFSWSDGGVTMVFSPATDCPPIIPVPIPVNDSDTFDKVQFFDPLLAAFSPNSTPTAMNQYIRRFAYAINCVLPNLGFAYTGGSLSGVRTLPDLGMRLTMHRTLVNRYNEYKLTADSFTVSRKDVPPDIVLPSVPNYTDLPSYFFAWLQTRWYDSYTYNNPYPTIRFVTVNPRLKINAHNPAIGAIKNELPATDKWYTFIEEPTPNRLVWSQAVSDTRDFMGGVYPSVKITNYANLASNDGDEITGLISFEEFLLVFKLDSIYRIELKEVTKQGVLELVSSKLKTGVGAMNPRMITKTNSMVIFAHTSGVYMSDGIEVRQVTHLNRNWRIDVLPYLHLAGNTESFFDGIYNKAHLAIPYKGKPGHFVYHDNAVGWTIDTVNANLIFIHRSSVVATMEDSVYVRADHTSALPYRDGTNPIVSVIRSRFFSEAPTQYKLITNLVVRLGNLSNGGEAEIGYCWDYGYGYKYMGTIELPEVGFGSSSFGIAEYGTMSLTEIFKSSVKPVRAFGVSIEVKQEQIDKNISITGMWVEGTTGSSKPLKGVK